MAETLNIAQFCPETYTLGPGKRSAIWVQGCPFTCPNCVSPDWIPIKPANLITVEQLAMRILSAGDLEGVTLSGGEPMLQAAALASLVRAVRAQRPTLSAICFSGFTLEQLRRKSAAERGIEELLGQLDVLIDGLYVERLNNGRGLRGSSNQRIHFLTPRYQHLREEFEHSPRQVEMQVSPGELLMVGVPSAHTLAAFRRAAAKLNFRRERPDADGNGLETRRHHGISRE